MKLAILFVFLSVMSVVVLVAGGGGTLTIEVREKPGVHGQTVKLQVPSGIVSYTDIVNAFKTGPLANVVVGGEIVGDHFKSMYVKYSERAQVPISQIGEKFRNEEQEYLYNIAVMVVCMYERTAAAKTIDNKTVDY